MPVVRDPATGRLIARSLGDPVMDKTGSAGGGGGGGGTALTKVNDTNVTLTLGGSPATALVNAASLTLGWTGTLAAARLNSNVVQAITNDTNVTGSITTQNLTLGWTGTLAVARGGTGAGTAVAGFNALSPLTTRGDLLTRDASNNVRLGVGSANQVLKTDGTDAGWAKLIAANCGATQGTGDTFVFATSPTLTTPVLGVATATSINKVAITAPATSATLTIADGKTLTMSNTLTFTGTDTSSVAFGAGGTVAYRSNNLSVFASTTSAQLLGIISDPQGSGRLVFATSPALTTPDIGTPTAGTLTACTGLPVSTGISGLGSGVAAWLATPTSANLLTAVATSNTGSGALVFGTSPIFTTDLTTPKIKAASVLSIDPEMQLRTGLTSIGDSSTYYASRMDLALTTTGAFIPTITALGVTGTFDDRGASLVYLFRVPSTTVIKRSTNLNGGGFSTFVGLATSPTMRSDGLAITSGTLIGLQHGLTYDIANAGTIAGVVDRAVDCLCVAGTGVTVATRVGVNYQDGSGSGAITNQVAVDVAALAKGGTLNIALRSAIVVGAGKNYCIYSSGSADSVHVGQLRLGDTTTPTALLDVAGKMTVNTSGLVTRYNNIATVANGVPSLLATIDLTTQAAAQSATALYTPAAAGIFRVSFAITLTRAASSTSTVGAGVNLNYTTGDAATAVVQNVPMWLIGSTTATTDSGSATNTVGITLIGAVTVYAGTSAMTFDVSYASTGGTTMQYAARVRVEALG